MYSSSNVHNFTTNNNPLHDSHALDDTIDRLETMLEEARAIPGWGVALIVVGVLTLLAVCIPLTALIMMSPCLCCYRDHRLRHTNEFAENAMGVLGDEFDEDIYNHRTRRPRRLQNTHRHCAYNQHYREHYHEHPQSHPPRVSTATNTGTSTTHPLPRMDDEEDEMAL